MSDEAQINSVAIFFFFTLLDQSLAYQATETAYQNLKGKRKNSTTLDKENASVIVNVTQSVWEKFNKLKHRGHPEVSFEGSWQLPPNCDFGLWKEYAKTADPSELLSLVWSLILRIPDRQISDGLGVTEGTVRHRVGRALRELGQLRS